MSGTNRLRVEPSERVDFEDFDFGVNRGLNSAMEVVGAQFLTDLADERAWILSGFAATNPSGTQIQVTKGRAILSRREEGVVSHGMITFEGDTSKIIDVAAFTTAVTYGVYIRFQYAAGAFAGRAFWDSSGSTEFTQTIATRRVAGWSMRIESSNPGSEWLLVGSFLLSGGPTVGAITDERPLYFEGKVDDSYPSGWSTDADPTGASDNIPVVEITTATATWPGGSGSTAVVLLSSTSEVLVGDFLRADTDGRWYKVISLVPNTSVTISDVHAHGGTYPSGAIITSSLQLDRRPDRSTYGVRDLQRFTAAVRQNLEDIKGRGLRRWWDRDIGGMNIGFDADPVEDLLAVGDAEFYLDYVGSTEVRIGWDTDDHLVYSRTTDQWSFRIGGANEVYINSSGMIVSDGLNVGFVATPTADKVAVGDALFGMNFSGANPFLSFDADDYISHDRGASELSTFIGAVERVRIGSGGTRLFGGINIGHLGTLSPDTASVGDDDFNMSLVGVNPFVFFDSGDSLQYVRSADRLIGTFGGATSFIFSDTEKPSTQIFCPNINTSLANPLVFTNFSGALITIPSAEVEVGQVYRIKAGGEVSTIGTATIDEFAVVFGVFTITGVAITTPAVGEEWYVDCEVRINTIAAGGSLSVWETTWKDQDSAVVTDFNVGPRAGNTTGNIPISVQGKVQGGNGSDLVACTYFHVERVS